jgi:hypothetical protein
MVNAPLKQLHPESYVQEDPAETMVCLGPERAQGSGLGFYYITQMPKPAWA